MMSGSDSWPGDCDFDTRFRQTSFLSVFSPLFYEACEKISRWLWKQSVASNGVKKPGQTCASPTAMI